MFKTSFHAGSSKCPHPWSSRFQTDEVLGDLQPLALVYVHQIVIFQWTQWFASSHWRNSSPLTTWGFTCGLKFLSALGCKCLPCSFSEEFKYITNEDTEMTRFIAKSDIPPLLGSDRSSFTVSGCISFSLRLCGFLFWPFLDPHPLTHMVFSYFS